MTQPKSTDDSPIPLGRAEYYPPESEVAAGDIGIIDMGATFIDVGWGLDDECLVTLGARAANGGDPLNYEMDMTPDAARRLAGRLVRMADRASAELAAAASADTAPQEVRP